MVALAIWCDKGGDLMGDGTHLDEQGVSSKAMEGLLRVGLPVSPEELYNKFVKESVEQFNAKKARIFARFYPD